MPPADSNPVSVIRHLTRLLSAVASISPGNQVRVPQSILDQISGGDDTKALFESYDPVKREVVLDFRPKSLAAYLVEEPKPCPTEIPSQTSAEASVAASASLPQPGVSQPLSDEQLAAAEKALQRIRAARRMGIRGV